MPDGVTVKIKKDSWHKRHYQFWLNELEGEAAAYKENFCRYMRIVLITVPRWKFFHGRIMRVVPPWTIPAGLLAIAGVFMAFNLWPNFSQWVALVVGALVLAVLIFVGIFVAYEDYPRITKPVLKWGTVPIWFLLVYLIYKPVKWIQKHFGRRIRTVFEAVVLMVKCLLTLAVVASITWGLIFRTNRALYVTGIVAAVIGIAVASLIALAIAQHFYKKWKRKKIVKRFFGGVKETVKLGATYVSTKKEGTLICPFIDFEDEPAN